MAWGFKGIASRRSRTSMCSATLVHPCTQSRSHIAKENCGSGFSRDSFVELK